MSGSLSGRSQSRSGRCTLRSFYGHQPLVYENHGIDARYTGPHRVAPTMSARYGTGGNNVPLVEQDTSVYCIVGNAIDRQPQNGGNGCGYQENIAYTLTATDHHAIAELYQETVGALCRGDEKGAGNQYVSQNKCIVNPPTAKVGLLIRRLTPLECERLQGFPDGWTTSQGHQIPPVTKPWATVWRFHAWSTLCGELQLSYKLGAGGRGESSDCE